MLTLTPQAVQAISGMVAAEDLEEGAGLRIAAGQAGAEEVRFDLSIEQSPAEGDQVVEAGEVRVFLEPVAAAVLADRLLDAHLHGREVHFELHAQDGASDDAV